ncbi:MAG TPA: hypothetical protein VHG28_02790 [Longimicrobiaceae bacterium]|nr:hypothetical protein [Longimicrobiaceae bacterium]
MARRPNYGFEKRQKELAKQQKKEEKAERKRLRKEAGGGEGELFEGGDEDAGPEDDREGDGRGPG